MCVMVTLILFVLEALTELNRSGSRIIILAFSRPYQQVNVLRKARYICTSFQFLIDFINILLSQGNGLHVQRMGLDGC